MLRKVGVELVAGEAWEEGRIVETKRPGGGGDEKVQAGAEGGVFWMIESLFWVVLLNSDTETLPLSRGEREGTSTIKSWTKPDRRRLFPARGNRPQLLGRPIGPVDCYCYR